MGKSIFNLNALNEKALSIGALLLIAINFLPYFILGQDSHLLVHDNLDSNIVWVKMLLENGYFISHPMNTIEQVFNGVPLAMVYGTYDFGLVIFKIFGNFKYFSLSGTKSLSVSWNPNIKLS